MALATRFEETATWTLRGVGIATAIAHLSTGDLIYGTYCLLAVGIALIPTLVARSSRATWPVEVELIYLVVLIADMTLGNLFGLYLRLPWFDKVLHVGSACLIGVVAFFAVYVAHFLGRPNRRHPWIEGAAILLVTLGLGAAWEIGEYGVDQLLGRQTQGAPGQQALDDTMWDLMLDGVGGIAGAILGPIYMSRSTRSRRRIEAVAELITARDARRAARTGAAARPVQCGTT